MGPPAHVRNGPKADTELNADWPPTPDALSNAALTGGLIMEGFRADRRRLIGAGMVAAAAGMAAACSSGAESKGSAAAGWNATADDQDSWLDKPGTRHRMAFDSVSGDGGSEALGYADNFIHVNESDYGLKPGQLGVVVIFRHMSTPYGYNDAIWSKYGNKFIEAMKLKDNAAKRAATMNPRLSKDPADKPPPKGLEWATDDSISKLASKGVQFAVCGLATKVIAGLLAGKTGDAAAIEAELRSNLVPNARIVPAGISAVNRAQEHGYSFAYVG
jgi:intracellular sulfur oxidation DsrE/DsrF family protein